MSVPAARLIAVVSMGCAGLLACGAQHAAPPSPSSSSVTKPVASSSSSAPRGPAESPTATTTPTCVGLSICPPPPPDAEGNPACYYADGWRADDTGSGIEVWYFRDPKNPSGPEKITALVRKKDGTTESQDADIEPGQRVHRFGFPNAAPSTVQEVLFSSATGRCFVIGPG
ncbi:hypothetical protein [Mycobacterium sp. E2497]|uniref:hypothetical protein n=1 Tax=Mycobacterium sp. E2497 TaxID=1834135 RepID=UPI000801ECED|nr:hypothetical protein [Mycobacterium sp. E2497]OBI16225.1 hypothetical protein A5713_21980 [Mycobacterium sp. E2497]